MTDKTTLLNASKLSRCYGDKAVVCDLFLSLSPGDILGLLGPNGAGKTTTMDMLTGNLSPTTGTVTIQGVSLADEPKKAKQFVGYLPEQPPIYPRLTVSEFLRYCARLHHLRGQAVHRAVNTACERTGLVDVGQRMIGNLSKGYQQRVGIAQAIIHEPDMIILDEPTSGLDPIQIHKIRQLIVELGKDHGVILSTHILPEAQTVCNRINILNQGRIVYSADNYITGQSKQLFVRFAHTPDIEAIGSLDGVQDVLLGNDDRYQVVHEASHNPASLIAQLAVERQWGILEITPAHLGLENIFLNQVQGELLPSADDQPLANAS